MQVYAARSSNHYYSIEESFQYVEELLHHQYGERIFMFLQHLFEVLEKKIPKLNSIFIQGKLDDLYY